VVDFDFVVCFRADGYRMGKVKGKNKFAIFNPKISGLEKALFCSAFPTCFLIGDPV